MGLATLYNIPSSIEEMNIFAFNNMAEHVKIAEGLLSQFGVYVPYFILDPLPLNDMGSWLAQHQNLHNIMTQYLGSNLNDLTIVNFNDPEEFSEWIWLHAQSHYEAATTLRLQ